MAQLAQFPNDWQTALVLVAHPDDPEYGMSAAVNRWTSEGKRVVYGLATSGEAGIQGMTPQECGPLREDEQRALLAREGELATATAALAQHERDAFHMTARMQRYGSLVALGLASAAKVFCKQLIVAWA